MDTGLIQLTELENQLLISFAQGSSIKILMPHLIRSILKDIDYHNINQLLTILNIKCCQCKDDQIRLLHMCKILSPDVNQCGLIDKLDAKKLCKFLKDQDKSQKRSLLLEFSLPVVHHCFGEQRATFFPDLYTKPSSRCIKCDSCPFFFSTSEFVRHCHSKFDDVHTVHWGFHSLNWRFFIFIHSMFPDSDYFLKATLLLEKIKMIYFSNEVKKMKRRPLWRPRKWKVQIPTGTIRGDKVSSNKLMADVEVRRDIPKSANTNITPNVYLNPVIVNKDNCEIEDDDEFIEEEGDFPRESTISTETKLIFKKIDKYKKFFSQKSKELSSRCHCRISKRKEKNTHCRNSYKDSHPPKIINIDSNFRIRNELHQSVQEKLKYLLHHSGHEKKQKMD